MRVLLTLIKRQLIDNAFYFAIAAVIAAVLIVAVIAVTLSEQLTYLSSYALALILITPIFFCIASYAVGLSQTYIDRSIGISALLPTLPVRDWQIHFARLFIGFVVILTVLGPLAITGAILWRLLGPPQWLFRDWIADVFIGLSLTCIACYCLGLSAGRKGGSLASALRPLPLTIFVLLLVVIKGFGSPLLTILIPLLVLLLFLCCKRSIRQSIKTVASGFMVFFFLIIPLSLARYVHDGILTVKIRASAKISPSGVIQPEIENDPNVDEHSAASASVNPWYWHRCIVHALLRSHYWELSRRFYAGHYLLEDTGIIHYFESLQRGSFHTYSLSSKPLSWYQVNTFGPSIQNIHLDKIEGRLICRRIITDTGNDPFAWPSKEAIDVYVGPKGVSTDSNSNRGYFGPSFVHFVPSAIRPNSTYQCLVYDKHSRCFYDINFENKSIRKGPQLIDPTVYHIERVPSENLLGVGFRLPTNEYGLRVRIGPLTESSYLSFVDEAGHIKLLDPDTLELHGTTTYLPRPKTLFGWSSSKPSHLLDYVVRLIAISSNEKNRSSEQLKPEYIGTVTGSLSRQGMWTSVAVFDKDGKLVKTAHSEANFFKQPWGPLLTVGKYIFENLHPPVLTLASFFTAYSFEARSAHRALFLMPNSFVAMARDYQGNIFYMFVIVLLLMLPGLLLAGILARRVDRDAAEIGLSPNARRFWLIATLAFGLVAYITYRLTRPAIALVTCANCGNPRRPDMEKCHRCGSGWHVPEIIPPAWRVIDG